MSAENTNKEKLAAGQQPQNNQADSGKHNPHHHEKAIIKALVVVAIVVLVGFLMATYIGKFFKESGGKNADVKYYNGFAFVKVGNSWFTQWEREGAAYNLEFRHPPWDVENITVRGKVDERFQRTYMFMTFDPPDNSSSENAFLFLASADLTRKLVEVFDRNLIAACTMNATDACANRPVATCSTNASVIYLKVSNETSVFYDGNCARIQGNKENLTRAADKAMYQWLKIIRD